MGLNEIERVYKADESVLSDIKTIIIDMDMTLVIPKNSNFYQQYGDAVENAIAMHYEIDKKTALEIAQYYRKHYGGAEQALYMANVHHHFSFLNQKPQNFAIIYNNLNKINAHGQFIDRALVSIILKQLRKKGVLVILLTSSPDDLAKRALLDSGYNLDQDFDHAYFYNKETGPLKIVLNNAFEKIIAEHCLDPSTCLSIGDSKIYDVLPAIQAGAKACLISEEMPCQDNTYFASKDVADILQLLLNKLESRKAF